MTDTDLAVPAPADRLVTDAADALRRALPADGRGWDADTATDLGDCWLITSDYRTPPGGPVFGDGPHRAIVDARTGAVQYGSHSLPSFYQVQVWRDMHAALNGTLEGVEENPDS